jgi:hypothetical protein
VSRPSAAHAASHPRYAFPGYRCECGHYSVRPLHHRDHVLEKHADDVGLMRRGLPAREYDVAMRVLGKDPA